MSVRLLLDENFPALSAAYLRVAGYDVVAVAETYAGMDDVDISRMRRVKAAGW